MRMYTVYNTVETTIVPLDSESRSFFFFFFFLRSRPFFESKKKKKVLNEIEIKADCTSSYSVRASLIRCLK